MPPPDRLATARQNLEAAIREHAPKRKLDLYSKGFNALRNAQVNPAGQEEGRKASNLFATYGRAFLDDMKMAKVQDLDGFTGWMLMLSQEEREPIEADNPHLRDAFLSFVTTAVRALQPNA